jgi:ABC-2 type transport system permease protein
VPGRPTVVSDGAGFPASGTAQVLAPLPSSRTYRAARPAFFWLVEREVLRFLKIWHFTIAGHVVSALLFVVVFGFALDGRASGVPGVSYAQFILPGLAAQAMLNVGYINGTTSLFEARHYRYLNDVLASPLRWWEVNAALVTGGIVREVLTGAGVLLVGVPLTGVGVRRPAILLAAAVAVLIIGAQLGVLVGSYARSLDQVYAIETLLVLPLGFLGGIFYPVSRLPGPWQVASELNPAFYVVQSLRIGFLGTGDIPPGLALGVVYGLAAVLTGWSVLLFRSGSRLKP